MRERSWKLLGNSMAVLLFWTIFLAGQLTVFGNGTETGEELLKNDLLSFNSHQTVFQIADEEATDLMNEGFNSDASDTVYPLQTRVIDLVTPIVGVGGPIGILYMIANNLSNMDVAVKHTWGFVLKKCFHKGTKLKNGGCLSPDGTHIDWKGEILEFKHETVHVLCFSPKCKQSITISGHTVTYNGELIVQDNTRNDELYEAPKYQKRDDGSLWYTNLKVGDEMTDDETKEFKAFQVMLLGEQKKLMKKIYIRYGSVRRKALLKLTSTNATSPGGSSRGRSPSTDGSSRGRTSSPGTQSRGKLEKTDSMPFNLEDVDDSGYDSVEVDAALDKAFGRPEDTEKAGSACGLFEEGEQILITDKQIAGSPLPSRRSSSMTARSRAILTGLLGKVRSFLGSSKETSKMLRSASQFDPKSRQSAPSKMKRKKNSFRDGMRTKSGSLNP